MKLDKEVANLVLELVKARYKAGLSQREVGERLEITQSAVGGLETLRNDIRLSTLIKYARAIGYKIEFNLVEQPDQQSLRR